MVEQLELFKAVDRTTRQEECKKTWIKNKCVGTIVGATGFGGQTRNKFFYSDEYFSVVSAAVHIEESYELRSGNIGGNSEMENTEINSEITQGSESSYSVEGE